MHADLTRLTFDETLGFRSVLMQQGRVLLDAEWNEQTAITAHHDQARAADMIGRSGGPAPEGGAPGPFAILDLDTSAPPVGTVWDKLAVTPGHYYVDGVLVESEAKPTVAPAPGAWPLKNQPHLRSIGSGATEDRGLAEPSAAPGDRFAVFLDVFDHVVTADERPELLESALGGPDTAVRQQTVWQVQLKRLTAGETCSALHDLAPRTPRMMAASLEEASAADNPCEITAGGGYTRLENQLYRVEVFDVDPAPRYVWSRENGSVVAGLASIGPATASGFDAALTLDRTGRDDELSIAQDSLVEVTSEDRRLRHLPGYLAKVGKPVDLVVQVAWLSGGPASLASLGAHPVVRRWEGGPRPIPASNQPAELLEDGIRVRFPGTGTPEIGDYWLIPARSVQLAYGTTARQGTIEWPKIGSDAVALPPTGPSRHRTPLGILVREAAGWTLESDCRELFPPLTALAGLILLGGDGQEAMPGDQLPEPIRVLVPGAGAGAQVRFTAASGMPFAVDGTPLPNPADVKTDSDGVAAVRWTLESGVFPTWDTTQTLTIERLDYLDAGIRPEIVVTGRLSVADQVQWTPVCEGFAGTRTVQDALARLTTTPSLKLLGGDGQQVDVDGDTVPQLVRVAVDSPCGPVVRTRVTAIGRDGAKVVAAADGTGVPTSLNGTAASSQDVAVTDAAGVAAFVWQPVFPGDPRSDILTIVLDDSDEASVTVTAQLDPPGSRTRGVHVERISTTADEGDLLNDEVIDPSLLTKGITVDLSRPANPESVNGKPVGRLLFQVPWPPDPRDPATGSTQLPPMQLPGPLGGVFFPGGQFPTTLGNIWGSPTFATHTIEVPGVLEARERQIVWMPSVEMGPALERLFGALTGWIRGGLIQEDALPILARFQLDGWAIVDDRNPELHLNGHANTFIEDGRTRLKLPTTDEVTGGRFETWFRVGERIRILPFDRLKVGDFIGHTLPFAVVRAREAGIPIEIVEADAVDTRRNTILASELTPGGALRLQVAKGVSGQPIELPNP